MTSGMNSYEKAAIITKRLLDGEVLTVPQIAAEFDMHPTSVWKIFYSIARVLPVIDEFEATHVKDISNPPRGVNPGNFAPRRWRICDLGDNPNR